MGDIKGDRPLDVHLLGGPVPFLSMIAGGIWNQSVYRFNTSKKLDFDVFTFLGMCALDIQIETEWLYNRYMVIIFNSAHQIGGADHEKVRTLSSSFY